jgi:hypothetical protein
VRPAPYSVPDDIRATIIRLIAYIGALGALALAAIGFFQSAEGLAALVPFELPAPRGAWTTAEHPFAAFELLMPELAGSDYNYAIQRRTADSARKDVMTWGDATAAGPYAMVEIYRPGAAGDRFIDASSEIAARIVDYAVTDDVKAEGRIDSKFGPVPLVDFAVAAHGRERRCLGFAKPFTRPPLQIAGWYCSGGREVVDRALVGCMLDRLTLTMSGDQKLDEVFARAEVKRTFCGQRNPILAATPERSDTIPQTGKVHAALRGRMPTH